MSADWHSPGDGLFVHHHCGQIEVVMGADGLPSRWQWTDRKGRIRGTWESLPEAKRYARKLSGVQMESEA